MLAVSKLRTSWIGNWLITDYRDNSIIGSDTRRHHNYDNDAVRHNDNDNDNVRHHNDHPDGKSLKCCADTFVLS